MKKTLVIVIIYLSQINPAASQIQQKSSVSFTEVGNINRSKVAGSVPDVTLEVSVQKNDSTQLSDTIYAIRFYDQSRSGIFFSQSEPRRSELLFHNTNSAINHLYEIFANVFSDKRYESKDYSTAITLGTTDITIKRDQYADKPRIQCVVGDRFFTIRNKKELNLLFGKPIK